MIALLALLTAAAVTPDLAVAQTKFSTGSADPLIEFINGQIREGWEDNEVKPSDYADDAEWIRRVYLDVVGHIPPADRVEKFLTDKDAAKRSKLVDELLADPDYVRNMTEVWTNVLIGRNTPDRTSRAGMRKFLRESFARNRPWNDIVYDMVTAEGHFEENGAVNFLLAQLQGNPRSEEYHVEATARLTRIFLGMQVQCTQCHNHPFNEWKQNQFYEFNSFLRQTVRVDHDKYDPRTGQNVDDYSELVKQDFSGPVYFELRNGLVQVAVPNYFGTEVDASGDTDRRRELGRLMCHEDPGQQLARAYVNRMWGHFMGYGFTRPVDDMGPHNQPSHPELLDRLTDEFVKSGYDTKQLARWICNTEAYNLTSRFNKGNEIDNPAAGEVPLFSRMYVKTMQAEQLYDSLLIATNAHRSGAGNFEAAEQQRERWLRDFLVIFGGNEEDEPTLFSGSIPQALLMMNGPLVQKAISGEPGSYLNSVLSDTRYKSDAARMRALFISALGRAPTPVEVANLPKMMRNSGSPLAAYQDLYWALLNSNEFIVNH
jgi:hypothetical protein